MLQTSLQATVGTKISTGGLRVLGSTASCSMAVSSLCTLFCRESHSILPLVRQRRQRHSSTYLQTCEVHRDYDYDSFQNGEESALPRKRPHSESCTVASWSLQQQGFSWQDLNFSDCQTLVLLRDTGPQSMRRASRHIVAFLSCYICRRRYRKVESVGLGGGANPSVPLAPTVPLAPLVPLTPLALYVTCLSPIRASGSSGPGGLIQAYAACVWQS